jgi:hypothetical protein
MGRVDPDSTPVTPAAVEEVKQAETESPKEEPKAE